jgi:hypothetical protein
VDRRPVRSDPAGTLVVLEPGERRKWEPVEGRVLYFGRNRPEVHICVGADDAGVSRLHGTLEFVDGQWQVRTLGGRPVQVGTEVLRRGDEPVPLAEGCTALLVEGENPRDRHLVRVRVLGAVERPPRRVASGTIPVRCFRLDPTERLVLTAIAEGHLRRIQDPQPLTARAAADRLATVQPEAGWTHRKVEHLVRHVRERLAGQGIEGLVPEPGCTGFDNAYRRNLIDVLVGSGTLGAGDLHLLRPRPGTT